MKRKLVFFVRLASLYRLMDLRHWPRLTGYFLGVLAYRIFRIRLFDAIELPFRCCKVYGDIEGYSLMGLVFLAEIALLRPYERFTTTPDSGVSVLFDAGANCGYFSILRCLDNPALRAVCFEPHPATFRILTENIRVNNLERRITAIQNAVSDSDKKIDMRVSDYSSMATVVENRSAPSDEVITVDALSLDSYARASGNNPQALKIDVEGYEIDVLDGAEQVLSGLHELVVECHSQDKLRACVQILKRHEFSISQHLDLVFGKKACRAAGGQST